MTSPPEKPPLLFARQRQLLALLDALGGRAGKLDFQKLLFLYCQEVAAPPPYEFVPYRYGAFSFTSYADRRKLIERGLLADQDNHWQITASGRNAIGHAEDAAPRSFARRYLALRGDALVAETYRRFPYYAIHSEIAWVCGGGTKAALPGRVPPSQLWERRKRPGSLPAPRPRERRTPWISRIRRLERGKPAASRVSP